MPGVAEFLGESPYKLIIAEPHHADGGEHDHARAALDHHAGAPRRSPPATGPKYRFRPEADLRLWLLPLQFSGARLLGLVAIY
jgi:hypothetical protein